MNKSILYIHGLGGGSDSRIPSILKEFYADKGIQVHCHTYDFDPEIAAAQIAKWFEQYKPDLLIGESLGSIQTLRIKAQIPHYFVSPALGAPLWLSRCAFLAKIPCIRRYLNRIYEPTEGGDRQVADFRYDILKKYRRHNQIATEEIDFPGFAFFGTRDHYKKSGIVSIRRWEKLFGKGSYALYEGTHFMENEYIYSMLIPKINETLGL